MNDHSDTDDTGDGEGVWSPDIEQCFREALLLFPPCGRRKHILQEEGGGKMYGRNELIARHIRMRTGKIRTRKQVSSHIQVLARRKAKAEAASNGGAPVGSESPTSSINGPIGDIRMTNSRPDSTASNNQLNEMTSGIQQQHYYDIWVDRPIVTQRIRLVEFSAFIEYRQNQQMSSFQPMQQTPGDQASSSLDNLASVALVADMEPSSPLAPTAYANQQIAVVSPGAQVLNGAGGLTINPSINSNGQQQQPLLNSQQHHQQLNQRNQQVSDSNTILSSGICQANAMTSPNHNQLQPCSGSGFTRHSYVKIDYWSPCNRQTNKLEKIALSQIQDKFPEIGGSEGLFQRGPADAFFLVKFWADLNCGYEYNVDDQNSYFGFSCHFETVEPLKDITCSTKACSYGLQVVEKVEKIYCEFNNTNGRYSYKIARSPMCEFMIQFIKKLRQLPRASQMNSVLENFTVLQEITSESTAQVLLCLAYVFEVAPMSDQNDGCQYRVYKLTKD